MITHRDGIVGSFDQNASWNGPTLPLDDPAHLERWEPWVRASVLDHELLSHLQFSRDAVALASPPVHRASAGGDNHFHLWHIDPSGLGTASPTLAAQPVMSMIAPPDATFQTQLRFLDGYADLRDDRVAEILAQMGPPYEFWASIVPLHPSRTRWTIELLGCGLRLANYVHQRFKHALCCRRPHEYSPQVQPIIQTPGHGSLPSGHATEAHLVARLLIALQGTRGSPQPLWAEQLWRQAERIAINRTVAGVHFPVDSAAGQALGVTLAEYLLHRCATNAAANWTARRFDGTKYPASADWDAWAFPGGAAYITESAGRSAAQSPLLAWLYGKALAEWN